MLPKVLLAGLVEPVLVHGKVAAEEVVEIKVLRVAAPRSGFQQHIIKVFYRKDLHGRAALHKIPEHHALHRNTLEDELVHHAGVDGGNNGALAGNDLHKAVLLQPLQNAADRSARNAEPLAQLVFAQRFPGQDLQRADLVLENMIELISVL